MLGKYHAHTFSSSTVVFSGCDYRTKYTYDQVGNRLQEDRGQLDLTGSFNNLNQLTHLNWSGKLDVVGSSSSTNVLVQGYAAQVFTNNVPTNYIGGAGLHAGSNNIPIVAWVGTNATETNMTVQMPPTLPQQFVWDLNGNMTSDGQRNFIWDNENRLIAIETKANLGLPQLRSEFLYDAQSRRIQKKDMSGWRGSAYATTNITIYIWDGWLLLAELNGDNSIRACNVHGLDLSRSLQGVGGIGGLLCRIESGTNYLFTFDGNGNVTDVLDANANIVAHYEYDPFGRTVAQSGSYTDQNLWRFSTKQIESSWDLYYYGHRFYSPNIHAWLSRDPIGEEMYPNLFVFCSNDPVDDFDSFGLAACTQSDPVTNGKNNCKKCSFNGTWPPNYASGGWSETYPYATIKADNLTAEVDNDSFPAKDPSCCAVRQWLTGEVKLNGEVSNTFWSWGKQITINKTTPTEETQWFLFQSDGTACSYGDQPSWGLESHDKISGYVEFKTVIYDMCQDEDIKTSTKKLLYQSSYTAVLGWWWYDKRLKWQ
jgi:RHS repeat-associated protein